MGDQRALERNIQRQQDISFRIAETREDFGVRSERLGEDTDTSRSRFLEDAARRLSEVETRQSGQSLGSELADVLENAVKRALAAELSGYLTGKVFDIGVSLITAALGALGIKDAIGGLLGRLGIGGGGDGDGTGTPALTTPDAGAGTGGTTSTPALTAPEASLAVLTQSTPALTAPTEAISVLTQSVPTLTAPETSLVVLTHSTPTLMAPLTSLEVLTHSTPTIIAPTTPISIPANAISPDIDEVSPITIPANAIAPSINPVDAITIPANAISATVNPVTNPIRIPAQAIIPTVHTPAAIDIPSNPINPVINAVNPITIPANAIDPVINAVSPITIPVNPITVQIDSPETIDLSKAAVILPALLSQLLQGGGDDGEKVTESGADAEERTTTGNEGTDDTGTINVADVIAKEGRRTKVFGTGNPTVQTNITPAELTKAIVEGNQQANQSSGWFDLPRTIAEGVQNVASAVLTSGVSVGGGGVSFGADAGGLTDAQVEALAAELGEDLDSSFRSDFIPTLLGNNPGQAQLGDADPDEDTVARAPAAPRFNQAAAAGVSAVADVLSLEALANVAQETTLSRIATATERIADVPLVDQLREAGVLAPQTLEDRAASPLADILSQGGLNLLSDFSNLQRRFDEGSIMRQDVDMSLVPGGTADNPAFVSLVNLQETQKVEVVGGSLDVTGKVDANVTNEVEVKQAGPFAVTQAGEFVVRLDSGQVLPVVVQGGRMVVDVSNLGDLAGALDIENVFRDFFGERVT